MNKLLTKQLVLLFALSILHFSCEREQYKGNVNQMTKKAEKAQNYLQDQAIELTQNNISKKDKTERKAIRRRNKEQERLNNLNKNTSKVKRQQEITGKFSFY